MNKPIKEQIVVPNNEYGCYNCGRSFRSKTELKIPLNFGVFCCKKCEFMWFYNYLLRSSIPTEYLCLIHNLIDIKEKLIDNRQKACYSISKYMVSIR